MAKSFKEPVCYDHEIMDGDEKLGTLRVKPSTIAWKPKGSQRFKGISIEAFSEWISNHSGARDLEK